MKNMFQRTLRLAFVAFMLCLGNTALAQGGAVQYTFDAPNCGTTIQVPSDGIYLNAPCLGTGNYKDNVDCTITVCGSCVAPNALKLAFEQFDLDESDTLYIYDGPSTSSPLLKASNNVNQSLLFQSVSPSSLNSSGCVTLRFKTDGANSKQIGFVIRVSCGLPCETPTGHIDSIYYKVRDGVVTDTCVIRNVYVYDTVWNSDSTSYDLIENVFRGVHLCLGEDVIFNAHGTYTNQYGYYHPIDATTTFRWNFGNGDTLSDLGARIAQAHYRDLDCYNVTLDLRDEMNCPSSNYEMVLVRIAQNPIKTIYDLATICNSDSLLVSVGYEGENGTITLKKISFEKTKSRTIACKTFLPDGPNCDIQCFSAPILFDDFPAGKAVSSAADICSICVNFEHEFMGDYTLAIVCPTGQKSFLKYKAQNAGNTLLPGMYAGGGNFTGYPYGGNDHHNYDGSGAGAYCDSITNMYGVGLDYCFSRNGAYVLVDGTQANVPDQPPAPVYLASNGNLINVDYTFGPIPAPFQNAGTSAGQKSFQTTKPSDHENQIDYYKPADDFSQLIGCPLNGTWEIEVCDTWGSDNGWIFSWALDICGISSGAGCQYQVGLDSVVWRVDSLYGDFDLGHWRGANIWARDSVNSYIASRDTAGHFPLHVTLYDEFGCVWDTITNITTVWTPEPHLGSDAILCDVETMNLDAGDRHTPNQNYSFMWEPFGDSTQIITTHSGIGSSTLYMVEVTNEMENIRCRSRDSIRVNINAQPTPNFDPGIYPLEGCEPFTIHLTNTSVNGDSYRWEFGDGAVSTEKNPTHTYATGRYGFKFYVTTAGGCRDSLVYDDLITVYSSPVAKFSWEPVNPTVLHPEVQFINRTEPQSSENIYYWEIQYDRDNPISYHTLTDVNPSFTWTTDGEDISGNYIARLIAKTNNLGPSGNIVECRDTIENRILLVNDFLQFPNVVTPNGDGVNDRFVIVNLVEGKGYPNNTLSIYDRWGKRVFHKENISSDDDFWDPAADNIPCGTYFWRFSGKGYLGNIQRNGSVEVLK